MFRKIVSLLLIFTICFSLSSCAFPSGFIQEIPELARIKKISEESGFNLYLFIQDEDHLTCRSEKVQNEEDYKALQSALVKVISHKGSKVTNFTADKITFPIVSLIVNPVYFDRPREYGEVIVWTNGYLITDSGDVYKCNLDFEPLIEAETLPVFNEVDMQFTTVSSAFRNLAMANGEWNKDLLHPVESEWLKETKGVKARVIREFDQNGPCITVEFDNSSGKDWDYTDNIMLSIELDGELYSIPDDPRIDSGTIGVASFRDMPEHTITTRDFSIKRFGDLIPGDYMLKIPAQCERENYIIFVPYTVE